MDFATLIADTTPKDIIETYTNGECPAMALALRSLCVRHGHRVRIGILYEKGINGYGSEVAVPVHAFIALDGGTFVDVKGTFTHREMLDEWGYDEISAFIDNDVSLAELRSIFAEELLYEPTKEEIQEAAAFARHLRLLPFL